MVENRSSLFGIIAIIIGASGLGLGAFSLVNFQILEGPEGPQGVPGDEGQDGIDGIDGVDGINGTNGQDGIDGIDGVDGLNGTDPYAYYCSSQPEIEDALHTIGSGYGTIIITENITLASPININDGGYYLIQGAGFITLDRNADDQTLNISDAKYCIIKDLVIDASDISSKSGIFINEENNNPVYIQNIQINGGNAGIGIDINSEDVWIQNCRISGFSTGINLGSNSAYCHILDNLLVDIVVGTGSGYGIYSEFSDFNIFVGNVISNFESGQYGYGIYSEFSDFNTFSGNVIRNFECRSAAFGIWIFQSDYNILNDNTLSSLNGTSGVVGIRIQDSFLNTIGGNILHNLTSDTVTYGFDLVGDSDSNTITGNTASFFQGITTKLFMWLRSDADLNTVIGNTGSGSGGITDDGTTNITTNNLVI